MSDPFIESNSNLDSPADHAASIVPNNSVDLPVPCRSIWVGVGGNVEVVTVRNETVTFVGAAAGSIIPVRAKRVLTSTTASSLVALW